jgi:Na+/melibiose symporter-like transporter
MSATEADLIAAAGVAVAGAEAVETVVASAAVAGAEVVGTAMVAAADVADARELKLQRNQIGTGVAAAKPAAKLGGSNFIFSVCLGLFAVGFAAVHGQQFALSNMLSRPPLPLPSPPSKLFGLF